MAGPTILQIIPRLDTGGAERATVEIAQALRAAGARALVASEGGRLAPAITAAGGELIAFPAATKNPVALWRNVGALRKLIEREGVDLIHARSRAPAWSALGAARAAQIPFVTTYHGAYGTELPFKNAYNSVMARGDRVIANSEFTAQLIRDRHGIAEDRLRVIHRGVDLAQFDRAKVTAARIKGLRQSWGVGSRAKIVLQAARLTGWKGQRTVIEAARRLRDRGALGDAVVVLAGDDQGRADYANELHGLIAAHGLGETVLLVGHCDDMAGAFAAAHAAVIASTEPEAFGRTAAEAQAMGCPVVAGELGATRETVLTRPGVGADVFTGWLVPPGDPEALAGALAETLALTARARTQIGKRARRHVETRFSLDRMRSATLAVYDELLRSDLAVRPGRGAGGKGERGKGLRSP